MKWKINTSGIPSNVLWTNMFFMLGAELFEQNSVKEEAKYLYSETKDFIENLKDFQFRQF